MSTQGSGASSIGNRVVRGQAIPRAGHQAGWLAIAAGKLGYLQVEDGERLQ